MNIVIQHPFGEGHANVYDNGKLIGRLVRDDGSDKLYDSDEQLTEWIGYGLRGLDLEDCLEAMQKRAEMLAGK